MPPCYTVPSVTTSMFPTKPAAAFLWLCLLSLVAAAQTRDTASLRGRVLDPTGAALVAVQLTLTNAATGFERTASTDAQGRYAFTALPLTGVYTLTVSKQGFAAARREQIDFRAGEIANLDFTLGIAAQPARITVYGTTEGVQADSSRLSTTFDLPQIEATPILGRKLSSLPLLNSAVRPARGTGDQFLNNTLFVINGGGRRQTTYSIDNATADDSWGRQSLFTAIPFSAVEEFTVLTNATSAEYGRSTGSAVNLVTKSGTNNFHGELLANWRPGSLEANLPLAAGDTADALAQGSGAISGPIVRDRTYFMLSGEYSDRDRDSVITSPLDSGLYTGQFRQSLMLARLDHRLSQGHLLTLRVNFDRFSDTNPADAVGGLNLPSTARVFRRRTYAAELAETATFGSSTMNEARFQFQLGSPITQFAPVAPSLRIVRPGVANEGESRYASLLNRQYQAADTLSLTRGRHNLKFGMDVIHSLSGGYGQEFGGGFLLGQFRLKPSAALTPDSQLTLDDVASFTQTFGNGSYRVSETIWALFLQDNFNVSPALTLDLGLRYENQTLVGDNNNFSPRVGFAWKLPLAHPTVLRGGYGIYYSEVRANLAADYRENGPAGLLTFSAAPGQFGFPTSLAPLPAFPAGAVLPPRDISVRPGERAHLSQFFDVSKLRFYPDRLLNPYTQQWTFGLETELPARWVLSLDYVGQHSIKLERPADLNAPAPFVRTAPGQDRSAAAADATRPIVPVPNGYRRIVATVNRGAAYYDALQVNLRRRFTRRASALLSYTWSHTINTVEADVPQQDANDSNFLGAAEKATSLLDQRHRFVISGFYELPWTLTVGTATSLESGRPFNVLTGVDNNGDGSVSDRPVVDGRLLPRNAGRGTPAYDVSAFVEKTIALAERARLSLRAESFNLLNHANIVGRNGTWGDAAQPLPTFGQPLGGIANVAPGREFQFLLRLRF